MELSIARSSFSEQLENTISEHQRDRTVLLSQIESTQRRVVDLERHLASKQKELSRQRKLSGTVESMALTPPDDGMLVRSGSSSSSDLIEAELDQLQIELDDRGTALKKMRSELRTMQEQHAVALTNVEALKSALAVTDRENKTLRMQLSRQRSGAGGTGGSASSSPVVVVSSAPPLPADEKEVSDRLVTLERELDACRREFKAMIALRDVILRQTEAMLAQERSRRNLLRIRVLAAQKDPYSSTLTVVRDDMQQDERVLVQELFHALGVNAKLMSMTATGLPCNVNVASLWEEAQAENVHWRLFRSWVQERIERNDVEERGRSSSSSSPNILSGTSALSPDPVSKSGTPLRLSATAPVMGSAFTSPAAIRQQSSKAKLKSITFEDAPRVTFDE